MCNLRLQFKRKSKTTMQYFSILHFSNSVHIERTVLPNTYFGLFRRGVKLSSCTSFVMHAIPFNGFWTVHSVHQGEFRAEQYDMLLQIINWFAHKPRQIHHKQMNTGSYWYKPYIQKSMPNWILKSSHSVDTQKCQQQYEQTQSETGFCSNF